MPALDGVYAQTFGAAGPLLEDSITFCPWAFNTWNTIESTRTASGLHFRNLHVDIGASPTGDQGKLVNSLLPLDDFKPIQGQFRGTKWLSDFFVSTLIHESTHARAFVGKDYAPTSECKPRKRRFALTEC